LATDEHRSTQIKRRLTRADDEFFFDGLVDFALGELGRYADGVFDGIAIGAAVADDANSPKIAPSTRSVSSSRYPFLSVSICVYLWPKTL
jgi:hypothetical protein